MANKHRLRKDHKDMVLNSVSKKQEKKLSSAVAAVLDQIKIQFPNFMFVHETQTYLTSLIEKLKQKFPSVSFTTCLETSTMRPDGGIIYLVGKNETRYPVLISEKKNQGTNDLRKTEGKPRQAMGNAIERLGKNVIGFRTALLTETIFPFVCFGDGCDFADGESIVDRVKTISMFGPLNEICLQNEGLFNRGSFFFRAEEWAAEEMEKICFKIAQQSVFHYMSVYPDDFPVTEPVK